MKLGYYQIFWTKDINTFEYRYNNEVDGLLKSGVIHHFTLIHLVNEIPKYTMNN